MSDAARMPDPNPTLDLVHMTSARKVVVSEPDDWTAWEAQARVPVFIPLPPARAVRACGLEGR